jgi:hypothetical protein
MHEFRLGGFAVGRRDWQGVGQGTSLQTERPGADAGSLGNL